MIIMNSIFSNNFDTRIRDKLESVLQGVFANNERVINDLETVKTVAGWLREAREDKRKIPSIITNEAIKWILSGVVPYFSKFLIDNISVETDVHANDTTIKQIGLSFVLKPYVEYVMKVNSSESKKARFTFNVAISGKLENIRFPSYGVRRYITVDKLSASISVSIINIAVYVLSTPTYLPLHEPIVLCNNQVFIIEKLSNIS